jgi:integrase
MGGVDLNTVRELLGHRSMAMTLRYSHLAPNLKAKAVEVLDRLWSPDFHQGEAMGNVVALK